MTVRATGALMEYAGKQVVMMISKGLVKRVWTVADPVLRVTASTMSSMSMKKALTVVENAPLAGRFGSLQMKLKVGKLKLSSIIRQVCVLTAKETAVRLT